LILIIDDQSMKKIFVTLLICIDLHRLSSIAIDYYRLPLIVIDYHNAQSSKNSSLRSLNLTWKIPENICHERNCQSMPIHYFFLWLSIGHRLADTNRYQLTNFTDWYRFIDCIIFRLIDFIDWQHQDQYKQKRWNISALFQKNFLCPLFKALKITL